MSLPAILAFWLCVVVTLLSKHHHGVVSSFTLSTKPFVKAPSVSRLVMKESSSSDSSSGGGTFSLSNLFAKESSSSGGASSTLTKLRGKARGLEPHPSVRPHISPLNRLEPGKDLQQRPEGATSELLPLHPDVRSGVLPNGLPYAILPNKSPPGRFEAHLQVFSGSADELEPQQGIAHLTEHVGTYKLLGSRRNSTGAFAS